MSLIIHLFNMTRFENEALIDTYNGDVADLQIVSRLDEPHQLSIEITSHFSRYQELLTRKDFGIRIEQGNQDMLFVFYRRRAHDTHKVVLTMLSYSHLLMQTKLDNIARELRNYSLATLLGELDSDIVFTPISGDRNIELTTGAQDNLKLLTEAVKYTNFFSWVDGGLIDQGGQLRPNIIYGDFRNSRDYFNTTGDLRLKPVRVTNLTTTDNIYDAELTFLESASVYDGSEGFSLLFPYVDVGTGFSQSTSPRLRRTDYFFVNSDFPIVKLTNNQGLDYYCIRNPFTKGADTVRVYEYEEPSNTQDDQGNFTTQTEVSEEVLYRRAVSYIQASQSQSILSTNLNLKQFTLAGTVADVEYKENINDYDNTTIYTQDYSGTYLLDNLTFNFNDFA